LKALSTTGSNIKRKWRRRFSGAFEFARRDNGQSLIEFALSLPILLLVVTGIFTFGIAMSNYEMLTNATSVGGHQLAISRNQTADPCATAVSAVSSAAPYLKSSSLTYSFVIDGVAFPTTTSCSSAVTNLVAGTAAQVTVTYPCQFSVYGNKNMIPSCFLTARSVEIIQ
jgi:Flp pilus assembly protein TadG